jgi:lysophospholipase L1-like esterase
MIKGPPMAPEVSFFNRLVSYLAELRPIEAKLVSLSGFPIERARNHVAKKVLSHHPDYVVVQFGSTDAIAALRRFVLERLGMGRKPAVERGLAAPTNRPEIWREANTLDVARWFVRGTVARCLGVPSRTPREVYRQSMSAIASELLAGGATPLILTPFRFGDAWSDHYSEQFAQDVEQLAETMGFVAVNGQKALRQYPARKVLLANGYHLSAFGHEVIAKELFRAISKVLPPKTCQRPAGS